jgi:hypothetical protein
LGEAGRLLGAGLVEALLIDLHAETAGKHLGALVKLLGFAFGSEADGREIFFEARAVETGLVEVLHGANEGTGLPADGCAERAESSAGFRSEEDQSLRGFVWNGHPKAFLAHLLIPGLDLGEPVLGRRVCGAAEEGDDHDVTGGLRFGEIGLDPEAVRGLEVRDFGDGEDGFAAADADVHGRAGEIEGGPVGEGEGRRQDE